MSDLIRQIKERINCVDYAQRCGLSIHKSGDRCISPLRSESNNKSSFVVNNDYYHDFGNDKGGDVIDFCANLEFSGDRSKAIRRLAELTGAQSDNYTYSANWVKQTQNLCNLIQKWHEALRMQDYDYLHNRRITDDTIKRLKIGYTGDGISCIKQDGKQLFHYAKHRIAIPYWKNNYVAGWNARATETDQSPKYLKPVNTDNTDHTAIFGLHTLDRTNDKLPLVICEGAFDALSFEQENYPILATMGGSFSKSEQLPVVLSIAKKFPYVLLCFDNDLAGSNFTIDMAKYLFSHHINFRCATIPKAYKDVSEYYAAGNDLSQLITNSKPGLSELVIHLKTLTELKEFCYQAARYISKPNLADMFKVIKDYSHNFEPELSTEYYNELKKACFSSPSDDVIAKYVSKNHQLKFLDNIGFYEYRRGYWQLLSDTEVSAYISKELSSYRTGSKIASILKLLKADHITTEEFNRKPLLSFINGTLNLTENTFTEHSPDDMLTIQFDFPYLPDKRSDLWLKFIDEISDHDIKRKDLLQEIAGYILFTDNSLQASAFLMGEGSNGKSVFVEVIEQLFPPCARSNVELSGLTSDFQRIRFLHSLVNFSEETKTDVSGAEAIFKQIVAGGSITACYKHKDYIDFVPRTKFVFACNNVPKFNDMSYGLERRMLFVKFVNTFKDYPNKNNPHEFKADRNIKDKLFGDYGKSAIFNWLLDGYYSLKSFGAFTETDDCDELKQTFREVINPISVFSDEVDISDHIKSDGYISTSDLYTLYTDWCAEAGHKPRARSSFSREYARCVKDTLEPFRTNSYRGYRPIQQQNDDDELL